MLFLPIRDAYKEVHTTPPNSPTASIPSSSSRETSEGDKSVNLSEANAGALPAHPGCI